MALDHFIAQRQSLPRPRYVNVYFRGEGVKTGCNNCSLHVSIVCVCVCVCGVLGGGGRVKTRNRLYILS